MTIRRIGKTDIQFQDPRLARLMLHINRLTEELDHVLAALSEGSEGQVLLKRSSRDFDAIWGAASGGSAGEANTAANVGTGVGIFRDKNGVQLNFRSLLGGAGIDIAITDDEVVITATDSAEQLEPMVIAGVFG